jgi:hypothetical protein
MWGLLLVVLLIALYFYYRGQKFVANRNMYFDIPPVYMNCGNILPTEHNRRAQYGDPTRCGYPGLNQGGHEVDLGKIESNLSRPEIPLPPVLPTIFQGFVRSIESFCGALWQPFIDAPNPARLNDKDQLLYAAQMGY